MKQIDPILMLLFSGILFFTGILFISEHYYPMDGQIFQVISGLLTGFSGAFFMGIKNQLGPPEPKPPIKSQETTSTIVREKTE